MRIVAPTKDLNYGDVLVTKRSAGKFVDHLKSGCGNCVFRGEECNTLSLMRACPYFVIFVAVESTEEIERARDLFALKGELM